LAWRNLFFRAVSLFASKFLNFSFWPFFWPFLSFFDKKQPVF